MRQRGADAYQVARSVLRHDLEVAQQHQQSVAWKLVLRLRILLLDTNFEMAEFVNGLAGLVWGVVVLLPNDTFGSSASFRMMANLSPEWAWGAWVFAGGAFALLAMFYGDITLRKLATLGGFFTWVFLTAMLVTANPLGTAIAVYPIFGLLAAWANLRLLRGRGVLWTRL